MRKIVATEYLTLDGVMEDPGGENVFKDQSWSFPFWSGALAEFKFDELKSADALLLGRVTYEGFAKAWPTMKGTGEFGERMNSIKKYVVSTTLKKADWNNSEIISTEVEKELHHIKQHEGKNILLSGSAQLFQWCLVHNLIDEYYLMVHPIVVGKGKKLFGNGGVRKNMQLAEVKQFDTGVVVLVYRLKV